MPLGGINHLELSVTDLDRSAAFYDKVLGWMGYSRLPTHEQELIIWLRPGVGAIILNPADPDTANKVHDRYAPGFHHLAFDAENRQQVDAFHAMLVQEGIAVLDAPAEYDYTPGYYAVFFSDPDGLKLELVHMPMEGLEGPPAA